MPGTKSDKKLILIVIDGLTPAMFEQAVESGRAPALAFLAEHGTYRRAVSTFPSLTPVCLSSIVTGAHSNIHHIPHLVWYHRGERRVVEYGSSFGAIVAAGTRRSILDTILYMNERHLGPDAVTVYEALEDAGLVAAAVNITCYRGRTRHRATLPGVTRAAYGPRRFFFYNLFESDATGAPLSVRRRSAGTVDGYAAAVGRWLVTRDGFDCLVFYLSDYDYASHAHGPDAAHEELERSDRALGGLIEAAGGFDAFLERYAVVLCSDHGQTRVDRAVRLQDSFAGIPGVVVTASNRAGMVYDLHGGRARELAERVAGEHLVLFRENGEVVARRGGDEGIELLDEHPQGRERVAAALANPNAGELIVSAAEGAEFVDLGGRHHLGGGSHGSLCAGDSEVPVLTVGLEGEPRSIVDLAPLALAHFGVEPPPYARPLARAA